jgi:putative tricarboxylic transport membrane protein
MADRPLGLLFVLLGGASILDGFRVTREYRASAVFDDIGPDRYAIAVGAILALLGIALIAMARGASASTSATPDNEERQSARIPPFVAIPLLLAGHIAVMPWVGYTLSTLLFMMVMFYVAGVRPLPRSLAYGGIAGLIFYLLFVRIADMPLPASQFIPWL